MKKIRRNSTLLCYSENAEVELRKLMSDLPKVVFAHCQWFTWCSISAFTFLWLGGLVKKKPLAHHEKKKSNHWTPSKLGIYPSPLSHLSVQKAGCSELQPTQCSFIAESTQIQCWSDGLRQNCYVQLHRDDFKRWLFLRSIIFIQGLS